MGSIQLSLSYTTDKKFEQLKEEFEKKKNLSGILKIIALRALHNGCTISEVAELLRTSYETVRLWLNRFLREGLDSLKPVASSGRPKILSPSEEKELKKALLSSPSEMGFTGGCWDCKKIKHLIASLFGKQISQKYLPEVLKDLGFSYKKARIEIIGKNELVREMWLNQVWPLIENTAEMQGASILFCDEAHFSTFGTAGYTWTPTGTEALIQSKGTWETAHVLGAIGYTQHQIHAAITEGRVNGEVFIEFLKILLKESKGHVHLILDNAPYHKSKKVLRFMESVKKHLTVHFLPAYSPDFNPIEGLWKMIKKETTHNVYFETLVDLKRALTTQLKKFRKSKYEIKSLFGFYDELEAA